MIKLTFDELISKCWIPIALSGDIGSSPKRVSLLNEPIAIWRDPTSGGLSAVSDVCPHRGASFSKGRVTSLGLSCPYHGLTVSSDGHCVEGPSLFRKNLGAVVLNSYNCTESNGIVWISGARNKNVHSPIAQDGLNLVFCIRDKIDTEAINVIENVFDVLHFAYVHQESFSDGRAEINVSYLRNSRGFVAQYMLPVVDGGDFGSFIGSAGHARVEATYIAPYVQLFDVEYSNSKKYRTILFAVPTAEGNTEIAIMGYLPTGAAEEEIRQFEAAERQIWKEDYNIIDGISRSFITEQLLSDDYKDMNESHSREILHALRLIFKRID